MKDLYRKIPLRKRSFLQRLLGQQHEDNAVIEINNLLAGNKLTDIRNIDIAAIGLKYKLNLAKIYNKNLREFYAVYLNDRLLKSNMTDAEIEKLVHLKNLLMLTEVEAMEIHRKVAGAIYKNAFTRVISNGKLTEEEELKLERLQRRLGINNDLADEISAKEREHAVKEVFHRAVADERLSPEEERELAEISKNLGVELQMDTPTLERLEQYKLYWSIKNGDLPVLDVSINLQKSESCYFSAFVSWHEMRTVTQRVNYHGPTARIRIVKGVYYRMGSISPQRVTSEEWKHIDSGQLFLTNKRIIFMGAKRNTNIRLNRILSFTPYSDGVELEKDAGRSPLFRFEDNPELFGMILSRLLDEG